LYRLYIYIFVYICVYKYIYDWDWAVNTCIIASSLLATYLLQQICGYINVYACINKHICRHAQSQAHTHTHKLTLSLSHTLSLSLFLSLSLPLSLLSLSLSETHSHINKHRGTRRLHARAQMLLSSGSASTCKMRRGVLHISKKCIETTRSTCRR